MKSIQEEIKQHATLENPCYCMCHRDGDEDPCKKCNPMKTPKKSLKKMHKMRIYRVYRTDNIGYDEYSAWIVRAENPSKA